MPKIIDHLLSLPKVGPTLIDEANIEKLNQLLIVDLDIPDFKTFIPVNVLT